jgi:hypothetical protein
MEDCYYIITKIENFNGNITYTNIGYVLSELDVETININYNNYNNWIETNKTDLENGIKLISEFFINTPIVFGCFTQTTYIEGLNLSLITNINNL